MASPTTGTPNPRSRPRRQRRIVAVLALSLFGPWVAMAAVVSMQAPSGGGELRIPVMLYGDPEELVSGLQFDLQYDPTQFELVGVSAGDAASGAGKEVILAQTTPGEGRVLITGFNNNSMTDGQVATVTLRPLNGSAPQYNIALGEVLASDPDGNSLSIGYADLYQYPPAPPAPPVETEEEPTPVDTETPAPEVDDGESPVSEPANPGSESPGETEGTGSNSGSGYYGGGYGNPGTGLAAGGASEEGAPSGRDRSGARSSRGGATSGGSRPDSGALFVPERGGRTTSTARGAEFGNRATAGAPSAASGPGGARLAPEGASALTPQGPTQGATTPEATEMALLRPARELVDAPRPGGGAVYSLALDQGELYESERGGRSIIVVLSASLTLALLALAHVLFGRVSRPPWRRTR